MPIRSIELRDPLPADRHALLAWRSNPEHQRLLMWRTGAETLGDVDDWVKRRTTDPHGCFYVIADAERPVGFIQLTNVDRVDRHAHLGMLIGPEERSLGLGSQALTLMEARARDLGVHKILLEVLSDNSRGVRFWTSAGYRSVGTLRHHHRHADTSHDVLLLEKILEQTDTGRKEPAVLPPIPNDPGQIESMDADPEIRRLRSQILSLMGKYKYAYNWTWFGRPIIQLPQDVMALQMLILEEKPDLIIETGIAHGGSLILSASLLELLGEGEVLGIDVDIRPHNRQAIEAHPLSRRISMIQGSSVDSAVATQVRKRAQRAKRVMVCLDSNHTADHVEKELNLYAPLVSVGQHLIVFDTLIEDMPASDFGDRPWGPGNSPKTAVHAFLKNNPSFVVDEELERRLLFSVAPEGYLRRIA